MTLAMPARPASAEHDPRWTAVLRRDPAADGTFVFAVATTGIFCRPSCPARRARPENVRFFASGVDARAAGFRTCLRCTPDATMPDRTAAKVERACRLIAAAETMPSLASLAAAVGLSPAHFHREFKAATGLTPKAFGTAQGAERVRAELKAGSTVTAAIYGAGFNASSRFYARSNEELGMTPTAYRKGGPDVVIRFAVGVSSLGAVLVAMSPMGVCAILLGDDPEILVQNLQDRFPRADLIGGDEAFEAKVAQVVGLVEEPARGLDLPLDLRGTAFQRRVWEALRTIPAGATASYAAIARHIGAPAAVRGVAGACAANPIAVAVPCHRVVRTDGGLSGYRWGVERKRALLAREARTTNLDDAAHDPTDP